MDKSDQLVAVAKAEDTYDLLQHIAWERVVKPALDEDLKRLSSMLVSEALGTPLPAGWTREQVAGKCYGIQYISRLFEKILKDGERALVDLQASGLKIT